MRRLPPDTGSTMTAPLQMPADVSLASASAYALSIHCCICCPSSAVTVSAAAVAAVTAVSSGLRHEMGHTWFQSFHCSRVAGAYLGTCSMCHHRHPLLITAYHNSVLCDAYMIRLGRFVSPRGRCSCNTMQKCPVPVEVHFDNLHLQFMLLYHS